MTKEWQEATNEYLKVGYLPWHAHMHFSGTARTRLTLATRPRKSIPFTVSAAKAIVVKAMYRASLHQRRNHKTNQRRIFPLFTNLEHVSIEVEEAPLCSIYHQSIYHISTTCHAASISGPSTATGYHALKCFCKDGCWT